MSARTLAVATAWLALLGLAPDARGYSRSQDAATHVCLEWYDRQVTVLVNEGCSADLAPAACVTAVLQGLGVWNEPGCSDFAFASGGTTPRADVGFDQEHWNDNINLIVWRESGWPHGRGSIALTTTTYDRDTGEVVDSDVELNGQDYTFGLNGSAQATDIQNTMAHEAGHMLGLDHSTRSEATMYPTASPGETLKRDLAQDDIDGLCHVYPAGLASPLCVARPEDDDCSTAGGGGGALLALVGLLFALRRRLPAALVALGALGGLLALAGCEDVRFNKQPLQVDTFRQALAPQVDILWVVDNSGTMVEERTQLGAKFDQFMSRLIESGAEFHIGIVSTDTEDPAHSGRLQGDPRVIDNDTPAPQNAFAANVQLPLTQSRVERGLDAMRLALSAELLDGHNAGFLRADAALFVILVTDEDDHSLGPVGYYTRWLEHLKGAGDEARVSLSAIVGPAPAGCPGAEAGARYLAVQEATGGLFYSICAEDFGPVVDALGISAVGLRRKFYLSEVPTPGPMQVLMYSTSNPVCVDAQGCGEGEVCAAGHRCAISLPDEAHGGTWRYEEGDNSIFFAGESLPPVAAYLEVAYQRRSL